LKELYNLYGDDSLFDNIEDLDNKDEHYNSNVASEIRNAIQKLVQHYSIRPKDFSEAISKEAIEILKNI